MIFYDNERIGIFIDGSNLYSTSKALGFDLDYRKLLEFFRKKGRFIRALYYTAVNDDQEHSSLRPLLDWLEYNGYSLVTKPMREYKTVDGVRRFKVSMAVELAIDALTLAPNLDHIVLFSGDGDYFALVEVLQRLGKRVTVISTLEVTADDLRRQADQFIDLRDIEKEVARLGEENNRKLPI